jgi:glycosyltransferase involved in cell wall biosynthesis
VRSAARVNHFIANSENVAAKIRRLYGKPATVIYPPVDCKRFYIRGPQSSYYLIVSALVPYKRIDIAVAAFNQLGRPLKIVGAGPLRRRLERSAESNIEFLGWVDENRLEALYAECQALIFPGEEDFGIVPLEAQASGRPVIGYGEGGLQETVIPLDGCEDSNRESAGPTGVFFTEQTPTALIEAVNRFEHMRESFDPAKIRQHALRFSRERFRIEVETFIDNCVRE